MDTLESWMGQPVSSRWAPLSTISSRPTVSSMIAHSFRVRLIASFKFSRDLLWKSMDPHCIPGHNISQSLQTQSVPGTPCECKHHELLYRCKELSRTRGHGTHSNLQTQTSPNRELGMVNIEFLLPGFSRLCHLDDHLIAGHSGYSLEQLDLNRLSSHVQTESAIRNLDMCN